MLGIILDRPPLVMVGIMALIRNGFNLLPVLPLDGGWVMHALLFSRHYPSTSPSAPSPPPSSSSVGSPLVTASS